jgi:hypothetical protein
MTFHVSRARATVCLLLVAAVLGGCGDDGGNDDSGNGEAAQGASSSQKIVDCLKSAAQEANFTVSESEGDLDETAKKATDRAVALTLTGSKATVAIDRSQEDATKTADAYRGGKMVSIEQYGTVVVAYDDFPDEKQRAAIVTCVESG